MLRPGQIIQLAVMALLGLALIMVNSADPHVGSGTSVFSAAMTGKHVLFALIAIIAMLAMSRINIRQVMQCRLWLNPVIWALGFGLLLVILTFLPVMGARINGARRWLRLGPIMFQPSELVKWTLIIALAWWCAYRRDQIQKYWKGLAPAFAIIGLSCAMIVIEDLGTAGLMAVASMAVLLAGGARAWKLATVIPPAACALVAAIAHSPYRMARLMTFLHPYDDPEGMGYQAIQSLLAISSGGISGRGLGYGIQKHGYLPADTSDFIFANICSELGLTGAAVVIGLYLLIVFYGLKIVSDSRDTFGRLLGLGVIFVVALQAAINIAVVTVLVPTKGIALPLLSAGGTGWIMTAWALGLVASLDNGNHMAATAEYDQTDIDPSLSLAIANAD